ncbi:MAG: hypothetical protein ACLP05_04435 [Candidatus Kryptoniota bacterium]
MSKFLKFIGLLFLPIAALVFLFAILNSKAGKSGKNLFIQEFDDQNIYG